MALRIHFTAGDLARTRLAEEANPLLELRMALWVMQRSTSSVRFDAWRRQALTALGNRARPLFDVVPAGGWSVDFIFPVASSCTVDLMEEVRRTPRSYLRADLAQWAVLQPGAKPWTARLGEEPRLFQQLIDQLDRAHEQVIAPYWPHIDRLARVDRALRVRHLANSGVEGLLSRLDPRRARWRSPVLEILTGTPRGGDVYLGGRGLLLIPSLFASAQPVVNSGAEPQPWMTYPLQCDDHLPHLPAAMTAQALSRAPQSLTALLGRTRATVLCLIAEQPGLTTTELARRATISPASASEHATVLRGAGLVTTSRHRNSVFHTPTPAGTTLLNASIAGQPHGEAEAGLGGSGPLGPRWPGCG